MSKPASITRVLVLAAVVSGPFVVATGGAEPAPAPREKPTDDEWLPKRGRPRFDRSNLPPSAFPELALPPFPKTRKDWENWTEKTREAYSEALNKLRPRFNKQAGLKIEPTDDTLRKLLKARLNKELSELYWHEPGLHVAVQGPGPDDNRHRACLLDVLSTVTEL
jgi:hypothetical protein